MYGENRPFLLASDFRELDTTVTEEMIWSILGSLKCWVSERNWLGQNFMFKVLKISGIVQQWLKAYKGISSALYYKLLRKLPVDAREGLFDLFFFVLLQGFFRTLMSGRLVRALHLKKVLSEVELLPWICLHCFFILIAKLNPKPQSKLGGRGGGGV